MKSVHTILSSLLAGMMMFSLAACTASGTGASGSDSSAVQTDAVPQGRWVERQADGISSGLVLGAAPAALADGSLVLYARDESTDMPVTVRLNSTDNGASWQSETLDWAEKTGTLARWAARQDGTVAFTTTEKEDLQIHQQHEDISDFPQSAAAQEILLRIKLPVVGLP